MVHLGQTTKTYLSALGMAQKTQGSSLPPSLDDELAKLAF
jgi:hypothetical protein